MKNRRWLYITIGILVLIILLVVAKRRGVFGGSDADKVETTKVTRQTIVETVNASGKVQPEKEVKISAAIYGEITALPVKEGQHVSKGQLLARIKPDQYQLGVEKANAAVNTALAQLANAKAAAAQTEASLAKTKLVYDRNKKLFSENAISQADWENSQAEYKVVTAQYKGAQESVKAAEYNLVTARTNQKDAVESLRKTEIFSPMDGIISKLNVELGEQVVGTMQMAGTELMRVANLAVMEVEVEVNENDIVRLALGNKADIDVDAYRGEVFKGEVTEIASSAEGSTTGMEKVTNFIVKVRILEDSYKHLLSQGSILPTPFRPGMSANVSIQTKEAKNVIAVPVLAVTVRNKKDVRDTTSADKDNEVVFIFSNGKAQQRIVKTGIQDDVYIEIKDGLKEGEEVISGPYRMVSKTLKDGDMVEKSTKQDVRKSG